MANENDKKAGQPAAGAPPPATRVGGRAAVGGVVVSPEAAGVTVTPKDAKEPDEATVKGDVSRQLNEIAQKMAAGAGSTPETRAQLALEVEALAQQAKDKGHPVNELDGLVDTLNDQESAAYKPDEKSAAHAKLVAEVTKIRDDINTSLSPKEDRQPKSQR